MTRQSSQPEAPGLDKGTIAICFVNEALVCIRERGMDAGALLQRAGIPADLLHNGQARVSAMLYGRLWHAIAVALDDEFFGMDRHRMKQGTFTLLCHAIIHSDTLGRALQRALRFMRLVLDSVAGCLHEEGGIAEITLDDLPAPAPAHGEGVTSTPPNRAFAYGTLLLILHGLSCWLIGRRIPLSTAYFRCAEPPYSDEWRVLFTESLTFQQAASGFSFPSDYLDMPIVQNERSMKAFLRSAPANFLVKYKNSTSVAARIRRRLRDQSPAEWPGFDAMASELNFSPATLRRRLENEGSSYRLIMADLRRDLAIMLLSDTERSIADISSFLGFAEISAFYRAFKKWTNSAPGDYRPA